MNGHLPFLIALLSIVVVVGVTVAVYGPPRHIPRTSTVTVTTPVHRDLDCSDFKTSFPTPAGDPDRLDADHDGVACEANNR